MITVSITREELEERKACTAGLELFDRILELSGHKRAIMVQ